MDLQPHTVRYKAGTDKTIKPGIHGKFRDKGAAEEAADRCRAFFGDKRAHVWIQTDQEAAAEVLRQEGEDQLCASSDEPEEASTPTPEPRKPPKSTKSMASA